MTSVCPNIDFVKESLTLQWITRKRDVVMWICWLSRYVAELIFLMTWWPPKGPNWGPPVSPQMGQLGAGSPPLTTTPAPTYHLLFSHLTTLLPSRSAVRGKVSYICIHCCLVAQSSHPERVFRNWSLPQWWLPQGLEFFNFPYWLLPGLLTPWSDLSTGGLCQPKAFLKFCLTIGICWIAGNFYAQS